MKKRDHTVLIARVVVIAIILLVVAFRIFSQAIGGTAWLGYNENGAFFVGNHGEFIEVSESIWYISKIWELVVWILYFLFFGCGILTLMIGGIVLFYRKKKMDLTEHTDDANGEEISNTDHD
jgi:hypothetical protein